MTVSRPRTEISTGVLEGEHADGINRYLGIPYAAPPFAEHRFALPVPPTPWSGIRDAGAFGATAPQLPYQGRTASLLPTVIIPGEDILTVNVWAPANASDLPVVFWLHGGAFERGSAAISLYDGTSFARNGIVFVSVGYRLGSEGFSVLDGAPRNLGLSDAAAALRWTHAEVSAFGGDPARITVMGESAGGSLAAALLSRPDTKHIPAAVVIQSGPLTASAPKKARRVTTALAKRLGVAPTRDAFLGVPPGALLEERQKQAAGSTPLRGAPGFLLVLDPDSLPISPADGVIAANIPVLIGTNTDEYRLWFDPAGLASITPTKLLLARLALGISAAAVREYRQVWPGSSTGEIFGQLATDVLLRAPAVQAASTRTAATFMYEFAWPTPLHDLGAAHALELGFAFNALHTADAQQLAGADAPLTLARRMHADWVRFITTGTPGWPAYTPAARLVQVYDTEPDVEPLRRASALDALPKSRR